MTNMYDDMMIQNPYQYNLNDPYGMSSIGPDGQVVFDQNIDDQNINNPLTNSQYFGSPMVPISPPEDNLPDAPNKPKNFFQELNQAAQNDPYTFYGILGRLARGDYEGIGRLMNQRQNYQLSQRGLDIREKQIEAVSGRTSQVEQRQLRGKAVSTIDSARRKAADDGVLEEFENLHGQVTTLTDARKLEAYRASKRKEVQVRKQANEFLYKQLPKNPGISLSGNLKKLYETDSDFREQVNYIRENYMIEKNLLTEKLQNFLSLQRKRMTQLDLAIGSATQQITKDQMISMKRLLDSESKLYSGMMRKNIQLLILGSLAGDSLPEEMYGRYLQVYNQLLEKEGNMQRIIDNMQDMVALDSISGIDDGKQNNTNKQDTNQSTKEFDTTPLTLEELDSIRDLEKENSIINKLKKK